MVMNKGFASKEASLGSQNQDIHVLKGTNYHAILGDLCGKIEGVSYYSGSSSSWFLRGALEMYEEDRKALPSSSGKNAFSPRGLTDVLLENLLLKEDSDDPLAIQQEKKEEDGNGNDEEPDQDYKNHITLAKALACDSSKYLPALADSLSYLVSSTLIESTSQPSGAAQSLVTKVSSYRATAKRRKFAITQEFLELWVNTMVDDSTPENLYEQLCGDLFHMIEQRHKLSNSNNPMDLPTHAFSYLTEGDFWHCKSEKLKSLSPPTTQATLRRASVVFRFLSLDQKYAALEPDTKCRILSSSSAMEWFLEVLKGECYPIRYKKQRRETSFGLLDLLLEEFKIIEDHPTKIPTCMEWLFSPNLVETLLLFFKETIKELVEEWDGQVRAVPLSKEGSFTIKPPPGALKSRTNRDIVSGEERNALVCATRYIKFIVRLPPKLCPYSSLAIVEEASKGFDKSGKDLLTIMLRRQESHVQRLRLVQLLIEEFRHGGICLLNLAEKDDDHIASRKKWLSSPGILGPILEECSRDPFLASLDATKQFLSIYGDPSWKTGFSNKPIPRDAPKAIPIEELGSKRTQMAALASAHSIPRWLSDAKGEKGEKLLLMLRNKMGNRLFGSNQGDQYNLFEAGERSTGKPAKQQKDQYNLFDR